MSKVKVVINNAADINIITKETLNSSLKKKGNFCLPFFVFVHFSYANVLLIRLVNVT